MMTEGVGQAKNYAGKLAVRFTYSSNGRGIYGVDLETGQPATLEVTGRHDPCIAIRAVPVVKACLAIALADAVLVGRSQGVEGT